MKAENIPNTKRTGQFGSKKPIWAREPQVGEPYCYTMVFKMKSATTRKVSVIRQYNSKII